MGNIRISLHSRKIFLLTLAVLINICIKFHNMRKKHGICTSVRNVEHSSQLMCHAVCNSKTCRVKGKTCKTGCHVHFLTGMHIASIQICTKKEYTTDFNCFFCKCRRKLIMCCTYIRFQCMGEYVHTCICCNSRRNTFYKFCIKDCFVWCQTFCYERILHMCICVIYNCKRSNF